MRISRLATHFMLGLLCLAGASILWQEQAHAAEPQAGNPANETCLSCHANQDIAAQGADGQTRQLKVISDKFGKSVHGKRACVECHTGIKETSHPAGAAHGVYAADSAEHQYWRLAVPDMCGKCHASERAEFASSVHGKELLENKNLAAAVCSDCHSTHDVESPATDGTRLTITQNCGTCHTDSLKSYTGTYHGQVNTLGYAYTAKCFDCHGSHNIQRVDDPKSSVHADNRLETCQKCHEGATASFARFEPHGTAHDFKRYPYIWIASKFMLLLLGGTFAFFWAHSALWFYREYKERKERKSRPQVKTDTLLDGKLKGKHYQRFPQIWRVAHLIFALSLMTLALTGMSVLYADSTWAPVVMHWLGGPQVAAVIHRTCAVLFAIIIFVQLIYFVVHIAQNRRTFDWFGPNSLTPRLQDVRDIFAMVKWFFGLGPKPVFDRWTYWQKFDYWAPLGAVIFIGATGLMLWFPNVTAALLPGWIFNVATMVHGELALLAVLFLFTVHFFNNHFRPDKFPLDVVMFTGSMRLEEFKREHRVEYNRLLASGELEKYLVDAPSQPMTLGAKVLGFALIAFGLLLLVFVLIGVAGNVTSG